MPTANRSLWKPKSFQSMQELSDELDQIEAAHQAGTLSTNGGWSVGQNLQHCGQFMGYSLDGFQMKMPWPIRFVASLIFKPMLTKPGAQMKPGFKLPKKAKDLHPDDAVSVEQGLEMMRTMVGRVLAGEQMTQDSPVLGKMTHEQWTALHLNHCRMHFGYLVYE